MYTFIVKRNFNAMVLRDSDANHDSSDGLEQRLYIQQDANWNVTSLTDQYGGAVERYQYDPYGKVTVMDQNWNVIGYSAYNFQYLFQAGRYDSIAGTYHFDHRDYDPTLGRWLQQDPAGYVDGQNLYQAFDSNPVNRNDPMGLETIQNPTPMPGSPCSPYDEYGVLKPIAQRPWVPGKGRLSHPSDPNAIPYPDGGWYNPTPISGNPGPGPGYVAPTPAFPRWAKYTFWIGAGMATGGACEVFGTVGAVVVGGAAGGAGAWVNEQ